MPLLNFANTIFVMARRSVTYPLQHLSFILKRSSATSCTSTTQERTFQGSPASIQYWSSSTDEVDMTKSNDGEK